MNSSIMKHKIMNEEWTNELLSNYDNMLVVKKKLNLFGFEDWYEVRMFLPDIIELYGESWIDYVVDKRIKKCEVNNE